MDINDVLKTRNNKYVKLLVGEYILIRFENKFEESKGESNGRPFVTYNCPCYIKEQDETVMKVWSGSSSFFALCVDVAKGAGMAFDECNFKIGKIQAEDGKIGWDIVVMNSVPEIQDTPSA